MILLTNDNIPKYIDSAFSNPLSRHRRPSEGKSLDLCPKDGSLMQVVELGRKLM